MKNLMFNGHREMQFYKMKRVITEMDGGDGRTL